MAMILYVLLLVALFVNGAYQIMKTVDSFKEEHYFAFGMWAMATIFTVAIFLKMITRG